tara:strand:+ start:1061 stop:1330 length:270 start_codon:yes stop_codon:yes gene_type:complete
LRWLTLVKVEGTLDELRELMGMGSSSNRRSRPAMAEVKESSTPKKDKRKLSEWNRYVKSDKNKIYIKRGPRKGRLDLAKMAAAFRKSKK